MGYALWSVVFGEQPSAAKWNILGTNDASFNDGTGIGTNAIAAASLATNAITLGYAQITSNFTTASATAVLATGLTAAVTIPAGGRRVRITAFSSDLFCSSLSIFAMTIWDGTVGSGTQLSKALVNTVGSSTSLSIPAIATAIVTPSAGSKTYNVGLQTTAGTAQLEAAATYPAFILVEAI